MRILPVLAFLLLASCGVESVPLYKVGQQVRIKGGDAVTITYVWKVCEPHRPSYSVQTGIGTRVNVGLKGVTVTRGTYYLDEHQIIEVVK